MRLFSTAIFIGIFFITASAQSLHAIDVSFEKDSRLPLVYLTVAVKTGSVSDPDSKRGLTRFMGSMLLRGTKNRAKEQIDLRLDELGASLGVDINPESLALRGSVLSSNLQEFLDLLTEIITRPSFPEREIAKLKSETVSEILSSLSEDSYLTTKFFQKHLFQGHPYGSPMIGRRDHVEGFSRTDLVDQYNRLFKDGHLIVVGSGDADARSIELWGDAIARLRPGASQVPDIQEPKGYQNRIVFVDKPDRTQSWIMIGQIGVHGTHPDYFPLYVGNYAFGGTFSSRLMKEIRVKRGWSYGAGSSIDFGTEPRAWRAHLFPASKYADQALAKTVELIGELKKSGITREEFEFAKSSLINSDGFRFDTPRKRVENRLAEKTLNLPEGFLSSYADRIRGITLDQVNDALTRFLKDPGDLFITVLGTASDLRPRVAKALDVSEDQIHAVDYAGD